MSAASHRVLVSYLGRASLPSNEYKPEEDADVPECGSVFEQIIGRILFSSAVTSLLDSSEYQCVGTSTCRHIDWHGPGL